MLRIVRGRVLAALTGLMALTALMVLSAEGAVAQNVVGITGGYGSSKDAIYPVVESRSLYGLPNFGISWRNYTAERVVGCFGIDLEYMQRGFSYAPYASYYDEGETLLYYTRKINTILLPIVWQPHVYMLYRRVRLFGEAAATFSYDFNSTYDNEYAAENFGDNYESSGDYEYMTARDNKIGYGLTFGGGLALLLGRYEVMARVRYYWGLSDVVRNRNKYFSNNLDGAENPFYYTPIRSSLNGLMLNFGVAYRFDAEGFKSWRKKREKAPAMNKGFGYTGKK